MNKNDKGRQGEGKVLPMDQYRRPADKDKSTEKQSVSQLLEHMRKVRKAVPVNYQLQEELRKKIREYRPDTAAAKGTLIEREQVQSRFKVPLALALALLLLLTIIAVVWQRTAVADLQPVGSPREVIHFWNADTNMSFTLSPKGDLLVARHGQILFADAQNAQNARYRVLTLSPQWIYHSPAFSPDGRQVAIVRQSEGGRPQLGVVTFEGLNNTETDTLSEVFQPLAVGDFGMQLTDLSWSPGAERLSYTVVDEGGNSAVWLVDMEGNTQMVTGGKRADWSPDGTKLVLQRPSADDNDNLVLVDVNDGTEVVLGQGEQPVWSGNGYLAFVSTRQQEKVLTFMPDGSPQFTVHQRVGEIRSVYAGADGSGIVKRLKQNENWLAMSTLLVSPQGGDRNKEIEWLKQMELQGIREPKVLLLDVVDSCHNPAFNSEGNMLFFTRQDGLGAVVMTVDLEKRLINRGEK
ncbi:PD40 domain-containing protein [Desulfofalx alkaliphila]|uniref:PD40 domain-containing protein n=1 Tax=Desulfofalx alkaliphila TaxID=105483 RepID=UPI0004E24D65|nr:PD40 domain-containing protein [Desulfofalx alkaliphila]